MSQTKITCFILLLVHSVHQTRSVLFPSRSLNRFGSNDRYLIGDQGKPFEAVCIAGELDLDHPTWVFTRDSWKRSPMDESTVSEGYDSEETGRFKSTLHFNRVRLDDYGFYECLSERNQNALQSFYLYINSSKSLLLPVEHRDSILRINSGGSAVIPCRTLNPTDPNLKVKLIRAMTGLELANTIYLGPSKGFEIQNAQLPDHDGEVECRAESGEIIDRIHFTLSLNLAPDGPIISPPEDCKQCFQLTKPFIQLDDGNGDDIHEGDTVVLKCLLTIPSSMKEQVELDWLTFKLSQTGSFNTTKTSKVESNGYVQLIAINTISNVTTRGPYKCASKLKDEYGTTLEQLYTSIDFKLIQFKEGVNKTIEWHKDTFNEVIYVDEKEAVKWVIGFTIHGRGRTIIDLPPDFQLSRKDGDPSRFLNETKKDPYLPNKFILTLYLDKATIADMGNYELKIFDRDDGSVFEPTLPMLLYINGKPKIAFEGANPDGFYHSGEDYNITAKIWSYPMNQTSIEITFLNCTSDEASKVCTPANAKMDGELIIEGWGQRLPEVAKSDSLDIVHHNFWNNGYSESFSIKVHGGLQSGYLVCKACRKSVDCSEEIVPLFVTDLPTSNGTFFEASAVTVVEGDTVGFVCAASKVMYSNVTWGHSSRSSILEDDRVQVQYWDTNFSYWTNISVEQTALSDTGTFTCSALSQGRQPTAQFSRSLQVRPIQPPLISGNNNTQVIKLGQNLTLSCGYHIKGDPSPTISWSKDEKPLETVIVGPDENDIYYEYQPLLAHSNKTFHFSASVWRRGPNKTSGRSSMPSVASIEGHYLCTASNRGGSTSIFTKVEYKIEAMTTMIWGGTIAGVIGICSLILAVFFLYHRWKLNREKSKYNQLLKTFRMGDPKGLVALKKKILLNQGIEPENVNLDECESLIGEDMGEFQKPKNAQMLPYDADKWEIALEKLSFQELLGEGHFGVVKKAKLTTKDSQKKPVAVKMLRSNPERTAVENLMSEVKIMIHLGMNVNIVNVLGACTTQLEKQELYVIVEYCEHGSILEVLRRHKQAFRRKTLQMQREESRASLRPGNEQKRRTASTSSTSGHFTFSGNGSIVEEDDLEDEEDYGVSRLSPPGRRDVLIEAEAVHYRPMNNMKSPAASIRGRSETIREKITLTINKLISWSEQIANGMDYLSSKKVVHGDLACRNILLARENVVKISDFGLAKYVEYKDYYKNEKMGPLPVKWLSLETLEDGVYTCQSDVWSYGVVLWEIFSLGESPYPGVEVDEIKHRVVNCGLRLSRPEHIMDPVFDILRRCQDDDPESRPRFSSLVAAMRGIASDYRLGRISTPVPAQPRAAFANSLYFNSDSSTVSSRPAESQDGYLIPSPPQSAVPSPHYYLKLDQ